MGQDYPGEETGSTDQPIGQVDNKIGEGYSAGGISTGGKGEKNVCLTPFSPGKREPQHDTELWDIEMFSSTLKHEEIIEGS